VDQLFQDLWNKLMHIQCFQKVGHQSLTEIFKTGFILYKRTIFKLLPLTLLILTISYILIFSIVYFLFLIEVKNKDLVMSVLGLLLGVVFQFIMLITLNSLIDGRTKSGTPLLNMFNKFISYICAYMICLLACCIAYFVFVIPGIYLSILLSFSPYLVVLRNVSIFDSVEKSGMLVSGYWWRTAFVYLTIIIIGYVSKLLILFVAKQVMRNNPIVYDILFIAYAALLLPLTQCFILSLFYDLDARFEIKNKQQ